MNIVYSGPLLPSTVLEFFVYHQRQFWLDSLLCEFGCPFETLLSSNVSVENSGMLKQSMSMTFPSLPFSNAAFQGPKIPLFAHCLLLNPLEATSSTSSECGESEAWCSTCR